MSSFQFQTLIHGFGLLVFDKCDRLVEMDLQTVHVSAAIPQEVLDLVGTVCN